MHRVAFSATLVCLLVGPVAAQDRASQLSIERIFAKGDFVSAPLPDPHWLDDGASYVEVRAADGGGTDLVRVDAPTGKVTVIAPAGALVGADGKRLEVEDITLSADERKALLFHNSVRVWRQNTRGVYHILDLASRRLTRLSREPGLQMFAKFSPDGRQVAFVRGNNLFVTDLATGNERQLTRDGSDVIINGTTDWVYEEELDLRDAFRWSPDSRRIAYWRFDQSPVPVFPMVDELTLYPRVMPLRYPKAGEPNSVVRVGVLDVASQDPAASTRWIDIGADTGIYIARMEWAGTDSVVIQRLPRRQNRVELLMASASTGKARVVLSDRDSAWVEVHDQPTWLADGKRFLWLSERSGWQQLYLYNRDGSLVRQVTRDGNDVLEVAGVDERRGYVYVVEAAPLPRERQIIRYSLDRKRARTQVTQAAGTHRVAIGPNARFMIDAHTTASTPAAVTLHELPSARQLRVLADNGELYRKLTRLTVRPPQFFKIPTPDGDSLNAFRIVPADFDSTRKYPVLMYVYGGPNSQTVVNDYGGDRYLWHQLLAQKGYVVVSVDNRGTGARGRGFRKAIYLNAGRFESQDQINSARWLASRPWVDGSRVGIWGWSYGGYMASLAAGKGGNVFRAAIAVAPVTDWRLYDTIYTERYMWLPRANREGYRESAPQTHVAGITADFLLVHGTGDDNVHPQNSLQLAERLQGAGKPFELMLYPNRTHSISGGNVRAHLFAMMTRFVDRHLGSSAGTTRSQRAAAPQPR